METIKTKTEIGIVTLVYDKEGNVSTATFEPTMKFNAKDSVLDFSNAKGNEEAIKQNAQLVFAAWFEQMNEIELADREKYFIDSEVVKCDTNDDAEVQKCIIRFVFRER